MAKIECICSHCGKEFLKEKSATIGKTNVFCSRNCYYEFQRIEKEKLKPIVICDCCGKEFRKSPSQIFERNYCSKECFLSCNYNKKTVICECCGKEFINKKSRIEKNKHNFCSRECANKGVSLFQSGENHPNYKGCNEIITTECDICKKEITMTRFNFDKHKYHYCSRECQYIGFSLYYSGENNPLWDFDKTDEEREERRNIEGYSQWIKQVYKKDNYTCQCCGVRNGNGKAIKLNAHHKEGYNWCTERRLDITNGVTLCEDCHKEFHHIYGYGNNTEQQWKEFINNNNNNNNNNDRDVI